MKKILRILGAVGKAADPIIDTLVPGGTAITAGLQQLHHATHHDDEDDDANELLSAILAGTISPDPVLREHAMDVVRAIAGFQTALAARAATS